MHLQSQAKYYMTMTGRLSRKWRLVDNVECVAPQFTCKRIYEHCLVSTEVYL